MTVVRISLMYIDCKICSFLLSTENTDLLKVVETISQLSSNNHDYICDSFLIASLISPNIFTKADRSIELYIQYMKSIIPFKYSNNKCIINWDNVAKVFYDTPKSSIIANSEYILYLHHSVPYVY